MAEITTKNYLKDLINQKNALVSTLQECGVEADANEKLNTLVPKVADAYEAGKSAGNGGYDEGYEAAQKAEYDRFWDAYQQNGKRYNYSNAFSTIWNDEIYNPKYPISGIRYGSGIFTNSTITDTKQEISYEAGFTGNLTSFPSSIKTIRTIHVSELISYINCFDNCTKLENITFEGVIGNNISFSNSPLLTHDSLMSIINGLKDYYTVVEKTYNSGYFSFPPVSGVVSVGTKYEITSINGSGIDFIGDDSAPWGFAIIDSTFPIEEVENATHFAVTYDSEVIFFVPSAPTETYTLTLGTTNLAKLTDSEKAIATEKGWTLA